MFPRTAGPGKAPPCAVAWGRKRIEKIGGLRIDDTPRYVSTRLKTDNYIDKPRVDTLDANRVSLVPTDIKMPLVQASQ